jgi:uncharacterized delta-60 repeat protein
MLPLHGWTVAAATHDGGLILSSNDSLKRLTPAGQLDGSFGEGGTVTPPAVAGGSFKIAGVAVDSQGRLLVAGTSKYPQPSQSPPAFELLSEPAVTTGRVLRYLSSGTLDPSFGDRGIVETDFGLPPPMSEGKQIEPKPLVELTGVAVDGAGRIVLSGGAAAGLRGGCAHDWFWNVLTYAAFVARLGDSGAPDTSFGSSGLFGGHDPAENPLRAEIATNPVVAGGDSVAFLRGWGHCPRAAGFPGEVQLTPGGGPVAPAEPHLNSGMLSAAAGAPDGSVVFLEQPERGKSFLPRVLRVKSDGALNSSFGRAGRAALKPPGDEESYLESIAVDKRNGVLVAGIKVTPGNNRSSGRTKARPSFLLMRLRQQGGIDTAFGSRGAVRIGFPSLTGGAALLLDPHGRAVVSGPFLRRGKAKRGLAIARYIPALN